MSMAKKNKKKLKPRPPKSPRNRRVVFMLNEDELNTMNKYLARYKIGNRSRWFRETLLGHIIKVSEDNYPTLFSENEMRR